MERLLVHPDCSWNAESLWSWRGSADLWSKWGCHQFWVDPYWIIGEYHRFPLQGQGSPPWARKLSESQISRRGHEGSWQGAWEHYTTRVHREHAVWLHACMQDHRCHIRCRPVMRKDLCHQEDLCGSEKCISSCGLLASSELMSGWCGSYIICMKTPEAEFMLVAPLTVHHGSGSHLPGVSYRVSLGKPVSRWPDHYHWNAWGITKADPLEDQNGRKGISG